LGGSFTARCLSSIRTLGSSLGRPQWRPGWPSATALHADGRPARSPRQMTRGAPLRCLAGAAAARAQAPVPGRGCTWSHPMGCWRRKPSCKPWSYWTVPEEVTDQSEPVATDSGCAHGRPARISWARLVERAFEADLEHCPTAAATVAFLAPRLSGWVSAMYWQRQFAGEISSRPTARWRQLPLRLCERLFPGFHRRSRTPWVGCN